MKRVAGSSGAAPPPATKRPTAHWSHGLLASMEDPSMTIRSDDTVVMIQDKYPKAHHHYLVLPKDNISSLTALNKTHIPLLRHMLRVARDFVSELTKSEKIDFQFGFHAVPSMARLHMHVVSRDFDSVCLKHKKHWNSFTTEFFLDATWVLSSLEESGRVKLKEKAYYESLLKRSLRCHVCGEEQTNLPRLKSHIRVHLKD